MIRRCVAIALLLLVGRGSSADGPAFRFVLIGDRTGGAQPGVFEQVWREVAAEKPVFAVGVGDLIEGLHDATAQAEWNVVDRLLEPYRSFRFYPAPGNHDIWSAASERLFQKATGHPPHYSFDYRQAHFTVLDNSRGDALSDAEFEFLEADLKAHAAQPVKFIVSHRPSWLVSVALRDTDARLQRLAREYKVQYVIAGHVHQMLRFELEGVTYLSMPSAGGHLRLSGEYEDGWFFGHALVEVRGTEVEVRIEETGAPHGKGRVTKAEDWGMTGLSRRGGLAIGRDAGEIAVGRHRTIHDGRLVSAKQ